jgi:ADP-ribosylglycohydrolase
MYGAILGDIVGSVYERNNIKGKSFKLFSPYCHFTDDTVLTVATMEKLLTGESYQSCYKTFAREYPDAGYGQKFYRWAMMNQEYPYFGSGNGSAMRISPVGWYKDDLESVLQEAYRSAVVSHNHPEGIKGAQATAAAVYLARNGYSKRKIKDYIQEKFGYNLSQSLGEIRSNYTFNPTCQGSVPQAMIAFIEAEDFEDAIRNAISIGGDSDTIACIAGGIAEAYYGINKDLVIEIEKHLDDQLIYSIHKFYIYLNRRGRLSE